MPDTIEQNLQRLITAKNNIATAITNKGGTVSQYDGLESFPSDIATIPAGLADVDYNVNNNRTLRKTDGNTTSNVFVCDNTPTTSSNNPITSGAVYNTVGDINSILEAIITKVTYAFLYVTAPSGVTITVSKGSRTLPTQTSTGTALLFNIPESGTWTITGSDSSTSTISITQQIAYYVTVISSTITVTAVEGATVTATSTSGNTYTATAGSGGTATITVNAAGTYTISATMDGISSNTDSVTVTSTSGETYTAEVNFITLVLSIPNGSTYTLTDGTTTYTGTSSGTAILYYLPNTGTWTASCTDGTQTSSDSVTITTYSAYSLTLSYAHTYGVVWDKTKTTDTSILTRTDDSENFSNPNPYYSGMSGTPSSPFDTLMPWSGMVKETVDGNVFVRIPKFWYKIENTSNSLSIQISDTAQTGFKVSPAHRAFNSNDTEKDYVYVGRYKCNSIYGSTSGVTPKTNITRAKARSGCAAISSGKSYQMDFATFWTIRMLYLVEFANWNSQDCIGYGCGSNSSVGSTGYTDSMTYHTGTTQTNRTTYGLGTQYRWIEGLWDNVYEWIDGIRFSSASVIVYNDPANYSDSSSTGAVTIGSRPTSSAYIVDFFTPSDSDFDWALYSTTRSGVTGSDSTYVCDGCSYSSSGVVLYAGGSYDQGLNRGLFYLSGYSSASDSYGNVGARLLLYP